MKQGAHDFLTKPFGAQRLLDSVAGALQRRATALKAQRVRAGAQDEEAFIELCGSSPAILAVRERIRRIAALDRDVLLLGEPGSGKYAAARTIHASGRRRAGPFISFDCAGEPAIIAEFLFGDNVADLRRRSALAAAEAGTLYMENLHRLDSGAQERLLRGLETGALPWGDGRNATCDVRVIAAFPEEAGADSGLRGDLYWRLAAHAITLPPLRDRGSDAAELFAQAFADARLRARLPPAEIPTFVFDALASRTWPGNAPELIAFAESCALDPQQASGADKPQSLHERMDRIEKALLRETLQAVGGDVRKAIEALRIPRKTFYDKVTRHGLDLGEYRDRRGH
jgi:two-component system C4-dicarboxylate transport response regulator DctD